MSAAARARLPTVVVPVYNALDDLDACLASLDQTLAPGAQVLVADDASTDPRVAVLLAGWRERSPLDARVVTRGANLGFPANCNAAFAETGDADIVLLNSDAIATPGWLEQMARCAASDARIASISPWSNNAEICSFPRFCEDNAAPEHPAAVAEAAATMGPPDYPDLPTTVGFCLYLRRAALRQLGGFDSQTFGSGYGEEND
ncbi:MAG: glycosyltransferase, partial [Arenimonas sp.]|nr:glycosyltransferase [Arenimonas sp.]